MGRSLSIASASEPSSGGSRLARDTDARVRSRPPIDLDGWVLIPCHMPAVSLRLIADILPHMCRARLSQRLSSTGNSPLPILRVRLEPAV